ncbi:hypothetical protein ACPX19_01645 [Winogradskyella sp. HB-48]|uniref:hypothetical protein n=1 Tax=Winogradskyella sp. HB-48 TaxID=3416808 RepID=UPI003CEB2322
MKTNYLLPHKYKIIGWFVLIIGIVSGLLFLNQDFESDLLKVDVFAIYNGDGFLDEDGGFFKIIENNSILDEIIALSIIFGGLIVGFTKERVEDEFIFKLRNDSLVWAIILNYIILTFTILFIYELTFFNVLVYNMFTPLLFFIFRFNFLKYRS